VLLSGKHWQIRTGQYTYMKWPIERFEFEIDEQTVFF